ncbi:protoporphyrinogen/coproporphyrinogen oxidase [Pseudomonas mediterranea]|uniref:protoporphyrinogen/coproporphyrinogen oxidase n=1 Tax=Pseudomonas mediterranea TaxID=183795 RepID=UPI0006D89440|nr:NAD(P)/FAD-dependent oxidoreductase [Pseudomonas mediterranea]MDU9027491.1 NAD(P)/FAD-dependent oxidoreductase [Pseudomonas mediterranea]
MRDSIIVIGAGIAGLAAASKLRDAGKKVLVLEASNRPGGRMVRLTRNGDSVEAGAQGIHTNYTETLKLVEQYGLESEIVHQTAEQVCYLNKAGRPEYPVGQAGMLKLLGFRGSFDLARFLIKDLALGKKFSLFDIDLDIPAYDNTSIEKAYSWAGDNFKNLVLRPSAHAMVGSDLAHTNLYHFLNLMKLVLSTKVMTLKNGLSSLPEAIAAKLDVRYDAPVKQLIYEGNKVAGVELVSGERICSNQVIVATPIGAAANILPDELVPAKKFLSEFPNIPLSLVFFYLDRHLTNDAYIYFGHAARETTFNMAVDHTAKTPHLIPSGKTIISAWPCYPDSRTIAGMPDEQVIAKALNDMEKFFPSVAGMVEHACVQRHPWGLARLSPGQHAKIIEFKRQANSLPGLSFANSDYEGVHMESGVRSGLKAAERVIRGS